MAIDYAKDYSGVIDERFTETSKADRFINKDFDFVGAKTVSVQTVGTATMNDYTRTGNGSRYGNIEDLTVSSQEMTMRKDRSFTFAIDKMDNDETKRALEAGKALKRQMDEVVTPEIDKYRFAEIVKGAKAENIATETLTSDNIYDAITTATEALDEAKVPTVGREIAVTPKAYKLMKHSPEIVLNTDIGQDLRLKGVIAEIDGMYVTKVTQSTLGANVNFIVAHASATTSPIKLAEYKVHTDAPGVSGELVEGRFYYDAFVLDNKKGAIYVHKNA